MEQKKTRNRAQDPDCFLYTTNDIAKMLGVSRPTVYKLMKDPGFPSMMVGGIHMVHKERFHKWFDNQFAKPAGPGKGEDDAVDTDSE
jgi:excisionase family DNA binding protein